MESDQQTTTSGPRPGAPLRRDPNDKVVAGVCSGLGRHFGIDPIIFRIGFVALTLAGASGVALYGLAWLFVPEDGEETSKGAAMLHGRRVSSRTLGWVLAGVAACALFSDWGDRPHRGGPLAALVLGGLVVVIFTSGSSGRHAGSTVPGRPAGTDGPTSPDDSGLPEPSGRESTPTGVDDTSELGTAPTATSAAGPEAVGPGAMGATPPVIPAPPPQAPRSPLGRITLSGLSILGGLLLLLDRTGTADVTLSAFLSISLVVVGLALVAGAWWGRSRGLIVVGVVLVAAAAAATVVDVPLGAGVGDRFVRPVSADALDPSYRLTVGELTLDLRDARPAAGRTEAVRARVGVGHLVVWLPADAAVVVDGRIGAGELDVLGQSEDGTNIRHRIEVPPGFEGAGRIDLRVSAGAGQVEVRR